MDEQTIIGPLARIDLLDTLHKQVQKVLHKVLNVCWEEKFLNAKVLFIQPQF
jgi:hypothetical protein